MTPEDLELIKRESEEYTLTLYKQFTEEVDVQGFTIEQVTTELIAWLIHRDYVHNKHTDGEQDD